jgi:hypothetical protein
MAASALYVIFFGVAALAVGALASIWPVRPGSTAALLGAIGGVLLPQPLMRWMNLDRGTDVDSLVGETAIRSDIPAGVGSAGLAAPSGRPGMPAVSSPAGRPGDIRRSPHDISQAEGASA